MNWNKFIIKLDRFFAWVLLGSMLLYFLSGYGITKDIINAKFSYDLHAIYLPVATLIAFAGHTFYAIHLALKRWRIWNGASKVVLVIFYSAFLIFFLFVQLFYKPNSSGQSDSSLSTANSDNLPAATNSADDSTPAATNQSSGATASESTTAKTFSLAELASYDGQNGRPAYVAVDGVVYDMTAVFINGKHFSHLAGSELSNAFYTRHAKSAITKYPVAGYLN